MLLKLKEMKIKERINSILKTKTVSHFGITFSATLINGILGVLFFVVLARNLGPVNFGLLSVAITTLVLIADIADFGINTGIINFVSKFAVSDKEKAYQILKLALKLKFIIWIIVGAIGWFIAPFIAKFILLKPELVLSLRLAFLGVGSALLFTFVTNSLQALQKFKSWGMINILSNSLRLLLVILLIFLNFFDINSVLITYIMVPLFAFIVGLFLLPKNFFEVKGEFSKFKDFFHYNKWIAGITILAAITQRLDTYLSTRLLSIGEVGIYSVAVQLTSIVPQFVYALATVVAPKLGSFDTDEKATNYLQKLQLYVVGLAMLGLLAIPVAVFLIPLIYGKEYIASVVPFIILLVAQLIFFISLPSHQAIFYYFSKPSLFALTTFGQFLIVFVLGNYLIQRYGLIGASLTVLASNIFNFIIPTAWVINNFSKRGKSKITQIKGCPVCGKESKLFSRVKGFLIYRCLNCGFGFTENLKAQKGEYHRDETYIQEEKLFKNIFQKRVNKLSKIVGKGKVLEVGCSTGLMLSLLRDKGFEVKGVEISKPAAEVAQKRGIEVYAIPFEKIKTSEKFDLIIFNHTLEHLDDFEYVLNKARQLLKPKAYLYVDLPNFDSLTAKLFRGNWGLLLPDEHKWHFTKKAFSILFKKLDFKIISVERNSGIWDVNNPLSELWRSLTTFKKRFFVNLFTLKGSWIISKLGWGTGLTVIARKK